MSPTGPDPNRVNPRRRRSRPEPPPPGLAIHVGSPRVRAQVVPARRPLGRRAADRFLTSFIVVWQPSPVPPPQWIELLRAAPFGSEKVRARDLHWDGKFLSVELIGDPEIEAFAVKMPEWEEFANTELARRANTPAVATLREAQRRAREIEERLRR